MPTIEMRDGAQVFVREFGTGEKPVVLLHGFAMESRLWLPLLAPLRRKYRFILPDLRGFGRSHGARLRGPDVLQTYAEDLHDTLEALSIERAGLAGISMGALSAVRYLEDFGSDRILGYAQIDQSPRVLNRREEGWSHGLFGPDQERTFARYQGLLTQSESLDRQAAYESLPKELKDKMFKAFGEFAAMAMSNGAGRVAARHLFGTRSLGQLYLKTEDWSIYLDIMRAYMEQGYDQREVFAGLDIPLAVLVGVRSTMYPYLGQLHIGELAPHAQIHRFERSGHSLPFEQPRQFQQALDLFFASAKG